MFAEFCYIMVSDFHLKGVENYECKKAKDKK